MTATVLVILYLFTGVIRYDAKVDASRDAMEKRR
jgi:hypothetical protein